MKRKIIVLYHRQPYEELMVNGSTIHRRDAGKPNGVIPLLKGFFSVVSDGMWIAGSEFADHPSVPPCERLEMPESGATCTLKRVLITKEELNWFYHKTSKEGFWPILHSFYEGFDCQKINWENFVAINKRFAETALEEVDSNTTIWIHDYNLWLAPYFIRKKEPEVKIAFFLHTPFPGPDIFNVISWREKIIESLLCCNHIVFSIPRYIENFIAVAKSVTNITVKQRKKVTPYFSQFGNALSEPVVTTRVLFENRTVQLDAIPVGTSCARIDNLLKDRRIKNDALAVRSRFRGRILIFAASRMDYVKGMDKLLECYSRLLNRRPELKGKVVLSLIAVQPAAGITAYDQFQVKLRQQVSHIIDTHSTPDWSPVIYSEAALSFEEMVSWYSATDIMWVPSLRDGTNLVCKEFLAVKKGGKGVLLLSEFVGAAVELHEAVLTNPYSYNSMDNAIDQALEMPVKDQEARNHKLYQKVRQSDVRRWSKRLTGLGMKNLNNHHSFVMKTTKQRIMNKKAPSISVIIPTYNRAYLLDYTLMSINAQTVDKSLFEVIIVDDGSSDNTRETVSKYQNDFRLKYLFQEDEGYRVATARNLGIANATGEILLFIDSGIVLAPDCISAHLTSHADQNLVVIGYVLGIEEVYDPSETLLKEIDLQNPGETINRFIAEDRYLDIREPVYAACGDNIMSLSAPWALFWTGNLSLRSAELQRSGVFDTAYDQRWGMEDIDLGYRIFKNDVRFVLNRKAASLHCPHFSDTTEKLRQEHHNKLYFVGKHNIPEVELFMSCTARDLNFELEQGRAGISLI